MPSLFTRSSRLLCALTSALLLGSLVAVAGAGSAAAASAFTPGDLVVVRVGDGSGALSSVATAVYLDEYSPTGTLVQSVPLPTTTTGANRSLTLSGSASSEGALSLSANGQFLTLAGYAAAPGLTGVASTTAASTNRVVGRIDGSASVDTSTAIGDAFSGNNIRSATTDDGTRFWAVGGTSGVRLAPLGGGATTSIASNQANLRVASIAGGQLYASSGSTGNVGVNTVGTGLPTTSGQTTTLLPGVTGSTSPYAYTFLDRSAAVPGADTLYVADDSAGLVKYSFNGTTWTARGTYKPAGSPARGVTGAVSGSGATLFATTTAGAGSIVKVTDTAAYDAPLAATDTTLATGSANTVLRGIAFAPAQAAIAPVITDQPQDTTVTTGANATLTVTASGTAPLNYQWYVGQSGDTSAPIAGATSPSYTTGDLTTTTSYWVRVTNAAGSVNSRTATVTVSAVLNSAPTIGPSPVDALALTLDDPFNPPATRTVTVADAETPTSGLAVSVTSSNTAVATGGSTGSGDVRTLTVNPVGVGQATLTVTVSDGDLTASTSFPVGVSAALPAGTLNFYGASDASTAVDLGGGVMVVADDETNVLRVYDRTRSGYPIQTLDVRAAGLALRDTDVTREIDIEGATRLGDTIYWFGSQGQNSSAKTRLNRQELFSTTVTGSGPSTTLTLGGSYQHLRDDIVAWDNANGAPLGLAAAATRAPEGDGAGGATGFNIEAAEFSADDSSIYLGFRGPLTSTGRAIVVPVTNPASLVTANPSVGPATFGTALQWDLGGRGIREIRKNGSDQYLIIAGPTGAGTGAAGEFVFYTWDGNPASAPLLRTGSLDSVSGAGKPESIVSVPDPLLPTSTVQVLTDSGDTVFYGDGVIAKELPLLLRKSTGASVAIGTPPACSSPVATIGSVQGSTETSPRAGATVTVRGTVVSDNEGPSPTLRGFYLQDAGDGDAGTSDGIFVFDNGADLVTNGATVEVTGAVSEYQGQTQITASTSGVATCATTTVVPPTDVTLPVASATTLESYEGMLVRFHQTLAVTELFQLGRFGQVTVSSGTRLQQPTAVLDASDTAAVAALQAANDLDRVIIDDGSQAQNPDPIVFARGGQPLSATNTLRGGDTTTDPVGVMTYTWGGNSASPNAYRLRPVNALGGTVLFDPTNPRPDAPPAVGTGGITVAGANLLNFFNTFTNCTFGLGGAPADCRGANDSTEYQRQLAKEVASITFLDADVVGYMEMENDGYGSASAVQALVNALNAQDGAGTWAFIDFDARVGGVNVAGTDAIKAGQLYRTDRVSPVDGSTFVDQTDQFERRPVAQTYLTPGGARFTVIANHFKSKGSCPTSGPDADQGDGQSCFNARRTAQATELARWVQATVVPGSGDPDVLLVGDLNSYAGEDPIGVLEDAGYTNLVRAYDGIDTYSYAFDGQWGSLDYALASASLVPQVTGAGDAHHNADEPSVLDYNTDFKDANQIATLYAPDRFRTSDHDPIRVGLDLPATASTTALTATPNPVATGSPVTLTATVAAATTATGTVTFTDGGTVIGSAAVTADGTATLVTSNLAAGDHQIVATYAGGGGLAGSQSAPVTVTVLDPVVLQPGLPIATVGVGYDATIGRTGATPITFAVTGGALPAGLTLTAAGEITGTPTAGGTSTFQITATNAVSQATATYSITVAKTSSTVTLTSSANPSDLGAPVTFTAHVSAVGAAASGRVQFRVDGVALGQPVPVVNGTAVSPATPSLTAGRHSVTVNYGGNTSVSSGRAQLVQVVHYVVRVDSPVAGATAPAGSTVAVTFALTDVAGAPISDSEAQSLLTSACRIKVAATGAQSFPAACPSYDSVTNTFTVARKTSRTGTGPVQLTITITYPGVSTRQVVTVPITLT